MEIFLLYISNDKPMFTGVKQGVYRVETWCLKPIFTGVFTGVKQGVYRGETGCFRPMFTGVKKGFFQG